MASTTTTSAAKADATGAEIVFEYDGQEYLIPAPAEWDLDVLEHYEEGKVAATVRALLGPEQYGRFRSKPRTVGDLNDLFENLQGAIGVEGN